MNYYFYVGDKNSNIYEISILRHYFIYHVQLWTE
jgi:hypothetical protein